MPDDVLLIYDDAMLAHDAGPNHPERPDRLRAIVSELRKNPFDGARWTGPLAASRAQLQRIHHPRYLDHIEAQRGRSAQLDPDTAVSPGSVDAAFLAAGAAIQAVEAVASSQGKATPSPSRRTARLRRGGPSAAPGLTAENSCSRAFALLRPPGHHAEADRAMGFCLFNNIAIAAAHAIAVLNCKRILIVDWDVHHGNGTQHSFYDRTDVLFFSSHQWPFWPGSGALNETGRGEGEGYTVNAPLPAGMNDAAYVALYRQLLIPIADQFKPDLVLVSAGFDAHRGDPLAEMDMTHDGFAALCSIVRDIADRHAFGRLALMLEGGYNLAALARSVHACAETLAGAPAPSIDSPSSHAQRIIDDILAFHRQYWKL